MVYYKVVLYTIALLHVANCKTVIAIHEPIKREISQALSLFFLHAEVGLACETSGIATSCLQ